MKTFPQYWFIINKYPEVREYLAEKYEYKDILTWDSYNCIGYDGCENNKGFHGCPKGSFHNDAQEITIEQFREIIQLNSEPNYEIY